MVAFQFSLTASSFPVNVRIAEPSAGSPICSKYSSHYIYNAKNELFLIKNWIDTHFLYNFFYYFKYIWNICWETWHIIMFKYFWINHFLNNFLKFFQKNSKIYFLINGLHLISIQKDTPTTEFFFLTMKEVSFTAKLKLEKY